MANVSTCFLPLISDPAAICSLYLGKNSPFNWFNYRCQTAAWTCTRLPALRERIAPTFKSFKHVRMRTGYVTADSPPSTHARNRMWVCPALFFEAVYIFRQVAARAERKDSVLSVLKHGCEIEEF